LHLNYALYISQYFSSVVLGMNYPYEIKKISVISLANRQARQRKSILIIGAEQNLQDADDNNHPYTTGKLCVVRSAYVLLMTGADAVVSLPEPSSETFALFTVRLLSVFPGDVAMEVLEDCRLSLAVTAGSVTLAAIWTFSSAMVLTGVMLAEVDAGILFFCGLSCCDELVTVDVFDGDAITEDDPCSNDVSVSADDESILAETSNTLVSCST